MYEHLAYRHYVNDPQPGAETAGVESRFRSFARGNGVDAASRTASIAVMRRADGGLAAEHRQQRSRRQPTIPLVGELFTSATT